MKKTYESPMVVLIAATGKDVITTSSSFYGEDDVLIRKSDEPSFSPDA